MAHGGGGKRGGRGREGGERKEGRRKEREMKGKEEEGVRKERVEEGGREGHVNSINVWQPRSTERRDLEPVNVFHKCVPYPEQ